MEKALHQILFVFIKQVFGAWRRHYIKLCLCSSSRCLEHGEGIASNYVCVHQAGVWGMEKALHQIMFVFIKQVFGAWRRHYIKLCLCSSSRCLEHGEGITSNYVCVHQAGVWGMEKALHQIMFVFIKQVFGAWRRHYIKFCLCSSSRCLEHGEGITSNSVLGGWNFQSLPSIAVCCKPSIYSLKLLHTSRYVINDTISSKRSSITIIVQISPNQ